MASRSPGLSALARNADCGAGIPDDQGLAEVVVATAFKSFDKSVLDRKTMVHWD